MASLLMKHKGPRKIMLHMALFLFLWFQWSLYTQCLPLLQHSWGTVCFPIPVHRLFPQPGAKIHPSFLKLFLVGYFVTEVKKTIHVEKKKNLMSYTTHSVKDTLKIPFLLCWKTILLTPLYDILKVTIIYRCVAGSHLHCLSIFRKKSKLMFISSLPVAW